MIASHVCQSYYKIFTVTQSKAGIFVLFLTVNSNIQHNFPSDQPFWCFEQPQKEKCMAASSAHITFTAIYQI